MRFDKYQGLGNDYLFVWGEAARGPELSRRLSDRRFGPGADGMIWLSASRIADFRMRIFNADGSEAETCGNGLRCAGAYLFERGLTKKTELRIETGAGIAVLRLQIGEGIVQSVSVEMGQASLLPAFTQCVHNPVSGAEEAVSVIPVSMGNPHAIIFVPDAEAVPLEQLGPVISTDPIYPAGTNVEFVQKIGERSLRMRVWERGSGVTMACGSGACAAVAAAVSQGLVPAGAEISVQLDGGILFVTADRALRILQRGPAACVYTGEVPD